MISKRSGAIRLPLRKPTERAQRTLPLWTQRSVCVTPLCQRSGVGGRGGYLPTPESARMISARRSLLAADVRTPPGIMEGVSVASEATPVSPPARRVRLDRPVLVSNLVSGALWLLFPAVFGASPMSLIGAVYVVAASLFLAAVYAREALTVRQEALAWVVPWLAAVALWTILVGAIEFGTSSSLSPFVILPGLLLGTLCYLGWQIVALAIRQFLAWRAKAASRPA